jgi:hypothetical protein
MKGGILALALVLTIARGSMANINTYLLTTASLTIDPDTSNNFCEDTLPEACADYLGFTITNINGGEDVYVRFGA